jgi:tetratricopeptide (TPR) repeat protein
MQDDMSFLHEADTRFVRAAELLEERAEKDSALYWRWGECWYHLGLQSGEAMDFHHAVEKMQKAEALGADGVSFWIDFGNTLGALGRLIGRHELLAEATDTYRKAVAVDPESYGAWLCYAHGLKVLYEWTYREAYLMEALEAYEQASHLNEESEELWLQWGELLGQVGWAREDLGLLQQSAEKLGNADLCQPDEPEILCLWGTVLMHTGSLTERLELLKEAEEKILKAVELDPDSVEAWCAYGSCLCELGAYFSDEEYYLQAIARYQYALTLDPENALLWQGLGQAQFSVGELQIDIGIMERALEAYGKATELDQSRGPSVWADWAVALMKMGDLLQDKDFIQAAVLRFEAAIQLHREGDHRELHWLYHYGCALDILGDFEEGTSYYERAIQVFMHILEVDPEHRHARHQLALSHFHLGEALSDVDCFTRSLEQFEFVVEEDEEDEVVWNDWGLALLTLSQLVEDPSQPDASRHLRQEAEIRLNRAASLGSVQAFYNLACLYSLSGRLSESLEQLVRARHHQSLPGVEDLSSDEWLEAVRELDEFQQLIDTTKS